MPPVRAFYSDRFVLPLPQGHRFPMSKYRLLRQRCELECPGIDLHEAQPATDGELALAHDPGYVDAVAQGTLSAAQQREIGFPWSPSMVERSRRSVGATIGAAQDALIGGEGIAANLAGGTHHAYADKGSGFCVFNDVAVAARMMQARWHRVHRQYLRVAVVDLDVHQGNGTASIFRDDDSVFTLSLHGERNFPFRKEPSDLDVALPDGCGDDAYLEALHDAMDALWTRTRESPPGLVFYLAGADPHEGDRLGRLALTKDGLAARDACVLSACLARRVPVVICMAGGYGENINDTVAVHLQTLRLGVAQRRAWASMEQCGS